MSRPTRAILFTEHLLHNLSVVRSVAKKSKLIAMVKANAYGHGIRSVGLRLQHEVEAFGVASIDEGLALREVGIQNSIVLMQGIFEYEELAIAQTMQCEIVCHTREQIEWIIRSKVYRQCPLWIKIDTGMGRLGFSLQEGSEYYALLRKETGNPIGIMSHLSAAEEKDAPITQIQLHCIDALMKIGEGPFSFANSATIFNFPQLHQAAIRPGICLYGISPFQDCSAHDLGLKPVMQLESKLIAIKMMPKGHAIGYRGGYHCAESMPIGIVPLGYGDGYPRALPTGTLLLVNDTLCPLVGTISMDMLAVDLRSFPNAKVGDTVVAWGPGLPVETVAAHAHSSPYELLARLQNRVACEWTIK